MAEQITRSIIVKAEPEHVYQTWRNFENFPYFMKNIQSVTQINEKVSHWRLSGPVGRTVEWEAEMTRDEPGKRIGWSTKDRQRGNITTSGMVTFTPLPEENETQVTVMLQYDTNMGVADAVADWVAKLVANPDNMLEEDLQNFKQYVETTSRPLE